MSVQPAVNSINYLYSCQPGCVAQPEKRLEIEKIFRENSEWTTELVEVFLCCAPQFRYLALRDSHSVINALTGKEKTQFATRSLETVLDILHPLYEENILTLMDANISDKEAISLRLQKLSVIRRQMLVDCLKQVPKEERTLEFVPDLLVFFENVPTNTYIWHSPNLNYFAQTVNLTSNFQTKLTAYQSKKIIIPECYVEGLLLYLIVPDLPDDDVTFFMKLFSRNLVQRDLYDYNFFLRLHHFSQPQRLVLLAQLQNRFPDATLNDLAKVLLLLKSVPEETLSSEHYEAARKIISLKSELNYTTFGSLNSPDYIIKAAHLIDQGYRDVWGLTVSICSRFFPDISWAAIATLIRPLKNHTHEQIVCLLLNFSKETLLYAASLEECQNTDNLGYFLQKLEDSRSGKRK